MKFPGALGAVALICGLGAGAAQAATDFSFRGNFTQDDDVQLFSFVVGATSTVTFRTYSYAGGTQADGTVVPAGGFDPILALFNSAGLLIGQNDDGPCSQVGADPVTGSCWDPYLSTTLGAGSYTVSIMQYDNFAVGPNLSDGFERTGQGNFTPDLSGGCGANAFCDVNEEARTSFWAFDILGVDSGAQVGVIPLPAAGWLLLTALGGLALARRRAA